MKGFNLYNLSNNFAFQLNIEGVIVNVMPNDAHPFGFSQKEILSSTFISFLSHNDKKIFLKTAKELALNHTAHNEFLLEKKNKKKVWYKISLTKRLEQGNEVLIVLCTFIDDLKILLIKNENRLAELNKVNSIKNQIIHSTQAVIIQLDTEQNIVSVSKGAERILGYSNKELINKKWFSKIVPQKKFPEFFYGFREFIQSKKLVRTTATPIICKGGTTKIVSWKTSKINISGKLYGTIAIGKEITEITKKINLLKESETQFRTLAQLVKIPLSFISLDGKINFVNKAYTREYGFKLNEIPDVETLLNLCYSGKPEVQKKKAIADWLNELRILAKEKKIISKRAVLYTKKGEPKIVEYSAVLGNNYIYYSYLNVTAQIEKEQILFASRENFKRIAENTPVAIAGCDATTFKVIFSNNQFKEVLGYSQNDINRMEDWGDLLVYHNDSDKEKSVSEWQQVKIELLTNKKQEIKNLERKIRCSNGSIKYFDIAITYDSNTIYALFYDITERKDAENRLKASEARFRNLAEQMLFPVSLIDANGKFIFLNKAFITKLGYNIVDFPDIKTMLNATSINPKSKKIAIKNWETEIKNLFKTKTTITNALEVETRFGEIKQVEYSASLCDDFVFYVYSDITEQKKAEKKLIDSETRFRNIVENLPVPLVSLNPITGDLFSNKKHKEIIGYNNTGKPRKDLSEFSIDDLVDEKSKKHFKNLIRKVRNNDENAAIIEPSYKVEIICKDKKIRTFEVTENIFGNTLYSVFHDITEQLKANILLQESEQKFKALAENMPMAIGGYDSNGKVIFLNNHFTSVTGYVAKDVPTVKEWYKKTQPIIRKRRAFYEHWMKTVEDFRSHKIKTKPEIKATSRCKDGSFKHFTYSFSVYRDITYILIIDITEQERAKKELEKSHKELKSLASYLQDVREEERKSISREIHDELGQQITGIKMDISSIFKKSKAIDDNEELKRKEIIEAFNNAIKSVRKISTQLRPSILDDLGVIATFEWQILEFKKRTGIECAFYYKIDEKQISIDFKNNLFRILQESLTNITRHSSATFVHIDFFVSGNRIMLIVADNGKGFNQNSPRETLGIIGMRERTSILNGTFSIVSEKMKGTKIIVSIPLNK